ncbi:response regulator [Myxococcota bacterium]|nr:response regulator [Myxococcota bacterium]
MDKNSTNKSVNLGQKPRILVVDDEMVILDILRDVLEYDGFFVKVAGDGESALKMLEAEPFDLVLSDLKMPGLGGLDLLHRIPLTGVDTKIVIMTGFGTVETAIDAMKKGAFDYLLKPFKPQDVIHVLRRAMERLRLERENLALRQLVGFYELSEALGSEISLDDQLSLLLKTVRENFEADGVSIILSDPQNPKTYIERASDGFLKTRLDLERIYEDTKRGGPMLASGESISKWLQNGSAPQANDSFMSVPIKVRGHIMGVVGVYRSRNGLIFNEGQRKGLSIFGGRAAQVIENARMFESLKETFKGTILGLAHALEAKDAYTHGHSDRVSMYGRLIATSMELDQAMVERVTHGGLMHDIGKIGIQAQELNKPQKLTDEEYAMFKSHPVQGKHIIEPIPFFSDLISSVYSHHESYDGSGYPEGLAGEDIPFEARILAVADTYDAMTSNRAYRKALPHAVALAEFTRYSGRQFDPHVVDAFLSAIEAFREERRQMGLPVPV